MAVGSCQEHVYIILLYFDYFFVSSTAKGTTRTSEVRSWPSVLLGVPSVPFSQHSSYFCGRGCLPLLWGDEEWVQKISRSVQVSAAKEKIFFSQAHHFYCTFVLKCHAQCMANRKIGNEALYNNGIFPLPMRPFSRTRNYKKKSNA